MRLRHIRTAAVIGLVVSGLVVSSLAARAELAVVANDGKQLRAGDPTPITPDSVSVIDLGHFPPKVIGTVQAPASMIGPPRAVAVGPGEKFAIVTASQKYDAADPNNPPPDDKVSVIDLTMPAHPKVIQTLTAGVGASGISLNRAGTLALVAGKGDGTITVFSVAGNRLTSVEKIQLDAKSAPTDVVFTPDGRKALVVQQGLSKILMLAIDGNHVINTGTEIVPGRQPYGAVVTLDGAYAINTNLGGSIIDPAPAAADPRKPRVGTITMIDLKTKAVVDSVEVGVTPEHVALSADGKYVAVVVANGSAMTRSDPSFDSVLGLLKIYRIGKGTLTLVASADTGHWGQGATWSDDGRLVLLECATERDIEAYHFDGKSLTRDKAATLHFESRPGAIATWRSR